MATTKAQREQARRNRSIAMSHPLREKIHLILTERTASPKEISDEIGLPVPNVSHHMKRLVKLDCAQLVDKRQVRGAIEHFYRATEKHLVTDEEWCDLPPSAKTDLLCDFFQPGVDDFVASTKAGILGSDEEFHLSRTRMVLDQEAKLKVLEIQERARLEIQAAQEDSANRIAESGEEPIQFTSWLGAFEVPAVG
jgi:hypothetical protein